MFALPGVDPDSIDLQLNEQSLTLTGKQPFFTNPSVKSSAGTNPGSAAGNDGRNADTGYKLQAFKRTVSLPVDADNASVKADYRDGILVVSVRKKSADPSRKITINTD